MNVASVAPLIHIKAGEEGRCDGTRPGDVRVPGLGRYGLDLGLQQVEDSASLPR